MTDLDRLKAWMAQRSYDSKGLSLELGYGGDWLANILNGSRPIRNGLLLRMAALFSEETMGTIFVDYLSRRPLYAFADPAKVVAQMTVSGAVQNGHLLPATSHICVSCFDQAKQYHHPSYLRDDWLNVVPLCTVCHSHFHTAGMALPPLGVVPTHVGIVRIAISQLIPTT